MDVFYPVLPHIAQLKIYLLPIASYPGLPAQLQKSCEGRPGYDVTCSPPTSLPSRHRCRQTLVQSLVTDQTSTLMAVYSLAQ